MQKDNKWIGYCTNVHAGFDLQITRENLTKHALAVKNSVAADCPMGIGLWLSSNAVNEMIDSDQVAGFADWLAENQLVPFTFNGFPYGNFHQDVVKHDVYLPTWADDRRREYSERLANVIDQLLPSGMEGSISTLPLAWNDETVDDEFLTACSRQLMQLATSLESLENRTGRLVYFCIEPEPGCVMQTSQTCIEFFQKYLLGKSAATDALVQRYLRICHDICHSAVMFEDQQEFIRNIYDAGIKIGKVQVSSAVHAPLGRMDEEQRESAVTQLAEFHEPRYLHQTVVQMKDGNGKFFEDLPPALKMIRTDVANVAEARVHFHVPLFLQKFGALSTSQTEILQCLEATESIPDLIHYEAETYAWNVLPEEIQVEKLADGIAEELRWLNR